MLLSKYGLYKKIEILEKPRSMLTDFSILGKSRVALEIKSGTGQWKAVDRQPVMRGGNVIPCNRHAIRLWVYDKEECQLSFLFPNSISAASRSSLISS